MEVGIHVIKVATCGLKWGKVARRNCEVSAALIKRIVERMFLGEYSHTFDDKSRITIPAKFREALAQGCVVTRGFEKHLTIYTSDTFNSLMKRSQMMSPTDPESRVLRRLIFAGASEATPDKSGRILIPQFLRDYAGLQNEVYVVGVGQYVEVWSKEGWEEQLAALNDPQTNSRRFTAFDIAASDDNGQ